MVQAQGRYRATVAAHLGKRKDDQVGPQEERDGGISRRDFVKITGTIVIVAGLGACSGSQDDGSSAPTNASGAGPVLVTAGEIPAADGYLLVDIKKCQGCLSCMLACSLIHEGVESLSLSRIQILQNSFEAYPADLTIEQCRQCVDPPCVEICPVGALKADASHGNVRMVDKEKCIGCGACHDACPYAPSRAFLAADDGHEGQAKSRKCDLCANAPYHWDDAGGGTGGRQACVAVCPVEAIMLTTKIPRQEGDEGYKVDLRGQSWGKLGYPTN
jgi:protein NrfC